MAITQSTGLQIKDGSIQRADLDISTATKSVITKVVAGTNVTISSTGADVGTGDVTINAALSSAGITRSINSISANTTAGAAGSTDYVYFCSGTMTLTLQTAVGNTNRYTIKNVGSGIITIATTSSQTIDAGAAPITITRTNNSLDIISDTSNWKLV